MGEIKRKDYHYTECGLENIIILDMPCRKDDAGEQIIEIPNINLLHAIIMYELVCKENGLSPEELRFIRTEMGLTQGELASRIKKDHQTIGRWERGDHPIDPTAEIIIRIIALEHLVAVGFLQQNEVCNSEELSQKCVQSANDQPIKLKKTGKSYKRVA